MLRIIVDVFELGDGEISLRVGQPQRMRPGDFATDGELRACRAISAATLALCDKAGRGELREFVGYSPNTALPVEKTARIAV